MGPHAHRLRLVEGQWTGQQMLEDNEPTFDAVALNSLGRRGARVLGA